MYVEHINLVLKCLFGGNCIREQSVCAGRVPRAGGQPGPPSARVCQERVCLGSRLLDEDLVGEVRVGRHAVLPTPPPQQEAQAAAAPCRTALARP